MGILIGGVGQDNLTGGAAGGLRVITIGVDLCSAEGGVNGGSAADFTIAIQSASGPNANWFVA